MPVRESTIQINASADDVFDFFRRPANRLKVTPPDIELRIVDAPDVLASGSRIEFEVRAFGQVQRATHIIDEMTDRIIVERQEAGSFRNLIHTREFTSDSGGMTEFREQIEFTPPGGLLGLVLNEKRIAQTLDAGFEFQKQRLDKLFAESGAD